ncbi:MAG: hypothetical protein LLF92_01350 [Planctomycetaceae bacterium]|nr:hypothetical protein [Planctomycetaceae bacterium]
MYVIDTSLNLLTLAATALQRFNALKNLEQYNKDDREFTRYTLIAIAILLVILFAVSFRRILRNRRENAELFAEYAEQRDLIDEEIHLLVKIIRKAGLRLPASIFTMSEAFDKGSEKLKAELFKKHNREELIRIEPILTSLRNKLGYQRTVSFSRGMPAASDAISSRHLPLGKELVIEREINNKKETIDATVIRNNSNELAIQLNRATIITFGENWKVRYFFGTSIWEFETFVISYDGNIMVLEHNDDVHFVNRRRFLRAPVRKKAYVASFPFEKTFKKSIESLTENNFPDVQMQPLMFIPAVVTELGGPGLRIETSLPVKQGERILIMFELERDTQQSLVKYQETDTVKYISTSILKAIENVGIVQEAGIVKRASENPHCPTIAVELMGLNDSEIDCLIRATNTASLENIENNTPEEVNA